MSNQKENPVAVIEEKQTSVAVVTQHQPIRTIASSFTSEELAQSDINNGAMIPDTSQVAALPVKLNEENLELEVGEYKDCIVLGIGMKPFPSMNPERKGQSELVKCVSLASLGYNKDGSPKINRWYLGAKLAVSTIENAIDSGFIVLSNSKTMVRITYIGQKKNKTNSFSSNNYDIEIILNK